MEQKRCVVVSGGDFSPVSELRPDDFIIACDRGYTYCERLGVKPDLIISDFDSYHGSVDPDIPLNVFASEKDDTDTMLAVRYAVEHNFQEMLLCCALGGRLDHTIANLQTLLFAQEHDLSARLISEDTEIITLKEGMLRLPKREDWSLSVFALDGVCRGVDIFGAKYPLRNAELLPSFPLGVSNQWADQEVVIRVREGILMVVMSILSGEKRKTVDA